MAKAKPVKKKTSERKPKVKNANGSARKASNSATSHLRNQISLDEGVWPLERDILFRPDRLKYVRKLIKEDGCVFCRASSDDVSIETLCVHQTRHSMVVLNKFPYNSGHLLILPQRHCGDLLALTEDEWVDLSVLQRHAMHVVSEVYQPAGFNMGLNQGAVAGAGIPQHLHFHLIPRWAGDLNFFPLIAETKVVIETLETTYARLKEGFEQIRGAP